MDGIFNIYKPLGITSHQVVSRVRRILNTKRVGHTGTLDPEAQGVLPICVGKGTKAAGILTDSDKRYSTVISFGTATDTQDATGKVIKECNKIPTLQELNLALEHFTGNVEQLPPMYSAVKVQGKKLYELARQGLEIERKERTVTIYEIVLREYNKNEAMLDISCSKGTYIRTLCNDIGIFLGTFAHMKVLTRTKSAGFSIENSITLEQLAQAAQEGQADKYLTPVDEIFSIYPKYIVPDVQLNRILTGCPIPAPTEEIGQTYRLYDTNGSFLCLSNIELSDNKYIFKLEKSFYG